MTEQTTPTTAETSPEDTSGLKKNNADLKRERDEWKRKAEAAEQAKIDAEEAAADAKRTDNEKLQKQIEKLNKDLADANNRAAAAENTHSAFKAETAIAQAIAANNVESQHTAILTSHFKSLLDGDGNIDGQSVADWSKGYFAKDGASYCRASNNSGGGATGGTSTSAPRMTKENFNFTEFAKIQLENPAEANAIADAVGRPELKTKV